MSLLPGPLGSASGLPSVHWVAVVCYSPGRGAWPGGAQASADCDRIERTTPSRCRQACYAMFGPMLGASWAPLESVIPFQSPRARSSGVEIPPLPRGHLFYTSPAPDFIGVCSRRVALPPAPSRPARMHLPLLLTMFSLVGWASCLFSIADGCDAPPGLLNPRLLGRRLSTCMRSLWPRAPSRF